MRGADDEARQQLYGSDRSGGKVDVISMSTLQVLSSIPVGSQPAGIDLDPNGDELAVALYGQGEIAFVDLDALTVITDVVPADGSSLEEQRPPRGEDNERRG